MGDRGPVPMPLDKLVIRGSSLVSRRRKAEQGRGAVAGRLQCPAWLGVEAKVVWRRVVSALRPYGHLRACDGNALARYCVTAVLHQRLLGVRDTLPDGDPSAIRLERRVLKVGTSLLALEDKFGMNPASRARLGLARPNPTVPTPDSRLLRLLPGPDGADPPGDDLDDEIIETT